MTQKYLNENLSEVLKLLSEAMRSYRLKDPKVMMIQAGRACNHIYCAEQEFRRLGEVEFAKFFHEMEKSLDEALRLYYRGTITPHGVFDIVNTFMLKISQFILDYMC